MSIFSSLIAVNLDESREVRDIFLELESIYENPLDNSPLFPINAEDLISAERKFRNIQNLNDKLQYSRYFLGPVKHWNVTSEHLLQLEKMAQKNWIIWALATFHASGYVREKALKNLSHLNADAAIPFLFLRLFEWVELVSEFAASELIKKLTSAHSSTIFNQFHFWNRMKHSNRISSKNFEIIETYYKTDPFIQNQFLENFKKRSKEEKRLILPYLFEGPINEGSDFFTQCFKDPDDKVKMHALKYYKKSIQTTAVAAKFYEMMTSHPLMPFRREALYLANEWNLLEPAEIWKKGILDYCASIRNLAQYHLKQLGHSQEAITTYRLKICKENTSTRLLRTAILGIGETGNKEDISTLLTFLKNSSAQVVQASIYSLYCLGAEKELNSCVHQLLKKSFKKISNKIYKVLLKRYF